MIAELVESPGFQLFRKRAEKEIKSKEDLLIRPNLITNQLGSQNLANITAIQGEIIGLRWWIDKADSYLKSRKGD